MRIRKTFLRSLALPFLLAMAAGDLSAAMLFGVKKDANVYAFDTANQMAGAQYSFTNGNLTSASAIAVGEDGLVYVFNGDDGKVLRFNQNGTYVDVFSTTTGGSNNDGTVRSMVFDSSGNLYMLGQTFTGSAFDPWIYKLDATTGTQSARIDSGVPTGGYQSLAFSNTGDIYLASSYFGNSYLYRLNSSGAYQETLLTNSTTPVFGGPFSIINGSNADTLYMTAHFQNRILEYTISTNTVSTVATGISSANDLVFVDGEFYATGYQSGESVIYDIDGNGTIKGTFGSDVNPLSIAAASNVPEPATYAALVGILALALVYWRRQ